MPSRRMDNVNKEGCVRDAEILFDAMGDLRNAPFSEYRIGPAVFLQLSSTKGHLSIFLQGDGEWQCAFRSFMKGGVWLFRNGVPVDEWDAEDGISDFIRSFYEEGEWICP